MLSVLDVYYDLSESAQELVFGLAVSLVLFVMLAAVLIARRPRQRRESDYPRYWHRG